MRSGQDIAASKTAFRARYANGVELICETRRSSATKFEGTEGRLEITLGGSMKTFPENLKSSVIGPNEIHLPESNPGRRDNAREHIDADHVRNFLNAVKTRGQTLEDAEVGHRTASLGHLGHIAIQLHRPLKFDPARERFVGDDEANTMLALPPGRSPWVL